ncbi:hypothetical protein DM02DRAFT_700378 [Periconia macrospinosa]|uniref:Uncharacterized protein n=1 Tax=Periconia macrospinosa TaxID=97972 RepID=A0A2V1EBW5_9PLEO|nr:hypothetical protein DM02DRAFT_700378 [Periconia macrospinosa]
MHDIEPSYASPPRPLEFSATNQGDSEIASLIKKKKIKDIEERLTAFTRPLGDYPDDSRIASPGGSRRANIGIKLRRVESNCYVRAQSSELIPLDDWKPQQPVFHVAKTLTRSLTSRITHRKIRIEEPTDLLSSDLGLEEVLPAGSWSSKERAIYVGQSREFLGVMRFCPRWSDDCASFLVVFSFEENQYGLKRCYWNFAIMKYKKDRHRESQTIPIPILKGLLDGSPISQGKHFSKTKSIEFQSPVKRQNGFWRRLQIVCVPDDMGLRVKITVAHRDGNDTETLDSQAAM